ncbi:MAG: CHAT domain-containing protein [Chloroflexota bacterium]
MNEFLRLHPELLSTEAAAIIDVLEKAEKNPKVRQNIKQYRRLLAATRLPASGAGRKSQEKFSVSDEARRGQPDEASVKQRLIELMTVETADQAQQVLKQYRNVLFSKATDEMLSSLILETSHGDPKVPLVYGAHQLMLRYLRGQSVNHPIIRLLDQCIKETLSLDAIAEQAHNSEFAATVDPLFFQVLAVYDDYLLSLYSQAAERILYLIYQLAKENGNHEVAVRAGYAFTQYIAEHQGDFRTLPHLHEIEKFAAQSQHNELHGAILIQIGTVYMGMNLYHNAIETFQEARLEVQRAGNRTLEGSMLADIGSCYAYLGDPETALTYHESSLQFVKAGDIETLASHRHSLALDYIQLQQPQSAIQELVTLISDASTSRRTIPLGAYYRLLGDQYLQMSDYTRARSAYRHASSAFRRTDDDQALNQVQARLDQLDWVKLIRPFYLTAVEVTQNTLTLEAGIAHIKQVEVLAEIDEKMLQNLETFTLKTDNLLNYNLVTLGYTAAVEKKVRASIQARFALLLGESTTGLGNYSFAENYYETAERLFEADPDPIAYANLLMLRGYNRLQLKQTDQAIDALTRSAALFAELKDTYNQAMAYNRLGQAYLYSNDLPNGIQILKQALQVCPKKSSQLRGVILGNLSNAYLFMRDFDHAEHYGREAIPLFRAGNMENDLTTASARLELIDTMRKIPPEKQEEILGLIREQQGIFGSSVHSPSTERFRLFIQAGELKEAGKLVESASLYEDIIAGCEVTNYDDYGVLALLDLAQIRDTQGKISDSLQLTDRLEALTNQPWTFQLDHNHVRAGVLNVRGMSYISVREYKKAIEVLEAALAIAEAGGNQESQLMIIGNLEAAYHGDGRTRNTVELLEKGLALAQKLNNSHEEGLFLSQLGSHYLIFRDEQKADEYIHKALEHFRREGNKRLEAGTLNHLAELRSRQGREDESVKNLEQALQIALEIGEDNDAWRSMRMLAEHEEREGKADKALEYYLRGIGSIEELRLFVPRGSLRANFLRDPAKQAMYEGAVRCYIHLNQPQNAFLFAERQRTRSLAEQLQSVDLKPRNVPEALMERYNLIEAQSSDEDAILSLASASSRAKANRSSEQMLAAQMFLASKPSPLRPLHLRPDEYARQRMIGSRQEVMDEIRNYDPDFVYVAKAEAIDVASMQAALADQPDQLVVEFSLGEKESYAFLLSSSRFEVLTLPDVTDASITQLMLGERDKEIKKANTAEEFANRRGWIEFEIGFSKDLPGELRAALFWMMNQFCQKLYKNLLNPVIQRAAELGTQKITFIPHRALALVPLHAAAYERDGELRYLIDDFEISYAPSSTVLYRCFQRLKGIAGDSRLLALANPTLDLPFAENEVEQISSWFSSANILRQRECQQNTFLEQVRDCNYLHFAGHAQYDMGDPMQSALLLAGKGETTQHLTLGEIFRDVRLENARLVALSACETGMSDINDIAGEFVGLPSGFMHAGAPAILSTLWAVNDLSTAFLIEHFYRDHLINHLSPAKALRAAQLWLKKVTNRELAEYMRSQSETVQEALKNIGVRMSDPQAARLYMQFSLGEPEAMPFEHPFNWAAFTLNGV